ncbi:hypothetical protein [Allomuricauda sp. NBRC 101325]|uniref:hypothetical protein n=1 Tax=Allomuricauda sp. NBRC 101325 TaxID=1113758 RepID=UPI00255525FF|nr:hypothetical protein [Muricauda sp. NBRC 101325]
MRNLALLLFIISSVSSFAQEKIKTKKNPIGWQYTVAPLQPLPEEYTRYSIHVDTDLDPIGFWGEVGVRMSLDLEDDYEETKAVRAAHQDTINSWIKKYMDPFGYPMTRTNIDPDIKINLKTEPVQMENVQVDIDYSDQESVLGEVNVTANLTVLDLNDEVLLNKPLTFLIDDTDGPTNLLKLRHLFMNPSFKLKFKMTNKPEKKKKLLEKRIKKFEADILHYFISESGKILADHFTHQRVDMYAATIGIKDKSYETFNQMADEVTSNINALTSFNKKKRKTPEEIQPTLEMAQKSWDEELDNPSLNPEIKDVLNYNLALTNLFLNKLDSANEHIKNIEEYKDLDKKTLITGNFVYYLKGLDNAIKSKIYLGDRAQVYQP